MANRVRHQPHPDPGATPTRLTASLGVIELQQTTAGTTANPAARKTARDHRRQEHESQNPTPNSHNRQPPTSHTAKPGETLSPELPIGGFRLRLSDEPSSLYLAAALDKTDSGTRTLISDIKEKRLTGLSIGFKPDQDRWGKAADGRTELRVVTRALLVEVSAVIKAANPGARIDEAREEYRSDNGVEYRSVPLIYRQVSGQTDESYPDSEPDNDSDDAPPNLRQAAAGAAKHCSNCTAFDRASSTCMIYDRYPIPNAAYVCNSWSDTWSPTDQRRKRARLAPAGTEALLWELQLHACGGMDKRVKLYPNDEDLAMELALRMHV